MHNTVIVRYGELALKGLNRGSFEQQLVLNIKDCLKKNHIEFSAVKKVRGRIMVYSADDCKCLENVFGIVSISPALETEAGMETIKQEALKHYTAGTFRISTQRIDKGISGSLDMNREIGQYVVDNSGAKVSLKSPDVDIGVELFNKKAYVFNRTIKGPGGLPIGVTGTVAVLIEDQNAIKAAVMMMKRGCRIILVKKVPIDTKELEKYAYGFRIKEANDIPEEAEAVVTSETLETLQKRDYSIPVLRPLIGE
ncbi:MAG TPA: hypothetical protein HA362_07600 [Nanoarchaeota archaeon]|nr:hypothetical protein [Nanoarchaeota archaeon]